MCKYDSLYFGDDGYVVRCNTCGNYQVAFLSTMLTLTQKDLDVLHKLILSRCNNELYEYGGNAKCITVPTPGKGINLILTKNEAMRFSEILEDADTEVKALELLSLFNQ
ncbi:MAG: DUF6686 family protein [Bacteroidota bacterium]